jgi:hypothetical protein
MEKRHLEQYKEPFEQLQKWQSIYYINEMLNDQENVDYQIPLVFL